VSDPVPGAGRDRRPADSPAGAGAEREAAPAAARRIVLNVGCGYPLRQRLHPSFQGPEWQEVRLDVDPSVKPDILCSMTDMSPVPDASVDAVYSSHNLEHLHHHEVSLALREFLRVLRPGGQLLITLPDLQKIAELVAADGLEDEAYQSPAGPITPLDMIYGHSLSLAQGNRYMAHKTGFTARTLQRHLRETGFIEVAMTRAGFDLWARALKRPG
jgi:SAM-dependent methyltransferase